MIHDFATFPKEPIAHQVSKPVSHAPRVARGVLLRLSIVVVVLASAYLFVGKSDEAPQEFSPGLAEAKEYEQAVIEQSHGDASPDVTPQPVVDNVDNKAREKKAFEAALDRASEAEGTYGFYESLQASPWDVPLQKGVYFTEEERKKSRHRYILQAASMKNRSDAVKLVGKLKSLKMPASYSVTTSSLGQTWYRVNVGPFNNRSIMNKAEDVLVSMNMMPLKRRVR